MANEPVSISVNLDDALARIGRQASAFKDRTVPNRQLAVQLQGWVFRNFQQGGAMQMPSWAPLAASTLYAKFRKGWSASPLIRTGHLRQSFRPFSDNDRAGVGSEVPYARYHETGTATIPARPMLPPRAVVVDFARAIYERWASDIATKD